MITSRVVLDFLQTELGPLMRRAGEIGEVSRRLSKTLEELPDSALNTGEHHGSRVKSYRKSIATLRGSQ